MTTASVSSPAPALNPRRWWSLIGLSAVTALIWVTASDISIALPKIGQDLGGSMDQLQWAVNGYFLAGSLIIVGGRLADLFGRRRLFAIGTVLVIVGSLVGATAGSVGQLVIGRILEGTGAAAVLPAALAIIAVEFPDNERPRAISVWIATCWGAQALGPLVGGALVDALGWAWIFWINLPLAAGALWLTLATTPESSSGEEDKHIDFPGVVTLVGAIFLLSFALVRTDNLAAGTLLALFAASVVLFIAFVLIERRSHAPLVDLNVFRLRQFDGAVVANFIANVVFGAVIFLMSLYLQVAEQHPVLEAGALLLPATIPILLLTPVGEILSRRRGPGPPITAGMILLVAACVLLAFVSGGYTPLLLPFILLGAGIGLQITPTAQVAVDAGAEAGEGVASGVYKASSMIGGSLGVAAATALFQTGATSKFQELIPGPDLSSAVTEKFLRVLTGGLPEADATFPGIDVGTLISTTFETGLHHAMWMLAGVSVLGVFSSWWLLLRGRTSKPGAAEPSAAAG